MFATHDQYAEALMQVWMMALDGLISFADYDNQRDLLQGCRPL